MVSREGGWEFHLASYTDVFSQMQCSAMTVELTRGEYQVDKVGHGLV